MSRADGAMISVRGLCKSYAGRPVLVGVDLALRAGEVLALLGPNGAGKTTLVRILATLTPIDAGSVEVAGHDLRRAARAARRSIGVAGQFATVDDALTGRENLAMIARLAGLPRAARRAAITREIERFDLGEVIDARSGSYSGGTRRRLDIAMSLISGPRVVLLDEPSVGLDPRSRNELWQRIRSLAAAGVTVLLTTQYLDEEISTTDATLTDIRARLDAVDVDSRPVQAIWIAGTLTASAVVLLAIWRRAR